jgi:hypothetical protein
VPGVRKRIIRALIGHYNVECCNFADEQRLGLKKQNFVSNRQNFIGEVAKRFDVLGVVTDDSVVSAPQITIKSASYGLREGWFLHYALVLS